MVKLIQAMEDLNKLKDDYDDLRSSIADDFRDDFIDDALSKIEELKKLRTYIEKLENVEVIT